MIRSFLFFYIIFCVLSRFTRLHSEWFERTLLKHTLINLTWGQLKRSFVFEWIHSKMKCFSLCLYSLKFFSAHFPFTDSWLISWRIRYCSSCVFLSSITSHDKTFSKRNYFKQMKTNYRHFIPRVSFQQFIMLLTKYLVYRTHSDFINSEYTTKFTIIVRNLINCCYFVYSLAHCFSKYADMLLKTASFCNKELYKQNVFVKFWSVNREWQTE